MTKSLCRLSEESVDVRRVRELEELSKTARETRARLSKGLQQAGFDVQSKLGPLRESMRRSQRLVRSRT
jgi:hypothetical protein